METSVPFESSWKNKELRDDIREQRQHYIEKLKRKHEKEERKKAEAHVRGEDTWMLDSVSCRLQQEHEGFHNSKKKKKKEKKQKKDKKGKKKKRKTDTCSLSSECDSDNHDDKWTEISATSCKPQSTVRKGPLLQRDSWMVESSSSGFGALPSITKSEFNDQRQKKKDEEKGPEDKIPIIEAGQHEFELNPYWKAGGSGLPEEDPGKKKRKKPFAVNIAAGDAGAGWWRKAYQRCVEQAKEQHITLEEVAADRYGSLRKLKSMLAAAETNEQTIKEKPPHRDRHSGDHHSTNRSRNISSSESKYHSERELFDNRNKCGSKFWRPDQNKEHNSYQALANRPEEGHSCSSPTWKKKSVLKTGEGSHSFTEEMDKKRKFVRPGDDSEFSYDEKTESRASERSTPRWKLESGHRNREERSIERRFRSTSRDRHQNDSRERRRSRSRSQELNRNREQISKGRERNEERRRQRSRSRERGHEMRKRNRSHERRNRSRSPKRIHQNRKRSRSHESRDLATDEEKEIEPINIMMHHSQSSVSSSESSDSESEQETESPEFHEAAAQILTGQELNELGAKMVRAELMGNEELAAQIKTQIDEARKAKEMYDKSAETQEAGRQKKGEDQDDEIILTRTDRSGNVRPLPARENTESSGRRKKEKIKTHGTGGSRERYFHDDDNKDLKSLVQQERLGTAEDSNYEFIKLAGKAFGGRQPMEDMDEVFMQGASKKESEATLEIRDRSKAIAEHRKMSAAMEKCHHCFEKVSKHLIIAIGLKVYLCLPDHCSMTEGHCLIVPMQHVTQSTSLDEDVFEEIQVYRRALTKMYQMQGLDCVFMETCKDLHRIPHMVIECVPLTQELGDMAPIYFKKAIQESETEWSQNKKVVDLSQKNIRKAVPKGFPFFAVDFGLQGGFAHVIEDEKLFPSYFGREILGGMMDLDPTVWRKPRKENFEEQRKKVLAFSESWKPVDWTQKLKSNDDSE